ncbi:MAG: alpha/beta hydrolase-fold protein [Acidobacteriota bacterium]
MKHRVVAPRILPVLIVLAGLCSTGPASAEQITIGKTTTVRSEILDEDRTLMISLPAGYRDEGSERYPVLWVLDGETRFLHTLGTVRSLASSGHIPPMIVVGITNTQRTRDLTPPWRGEPEEGREQMIETGGGADKFLRFLLEEARPQVRQSYRTAPFEALVGHSFGGLFAVHAITENPAAYQAFIAVSPSLWWDGGRPVKEFAEMIETRPDLAGRLYATLGDEGGDMLTQFKRFEEILRHRAPPSLAWTARVLEGEDHGSVPLPTVYYAMRTIFDRWPPPTFLADEGLDGLERHFAAVSEHYGYPVPVPENRVNLLGYRLLGEEKVDEAIAIFEKNTRDHPASSNVWDSLGDGLKAAGRLTEARDSYAKAVQLGKQENSPNLGVYEQNLAAAKESLAKR